MRRAPVAGRRFVVAAFAAVLVSIGAAQAGAAPPRATVNRVEWSTTPGGARVSIHVGGGEVRWSGGRAGASPADGLPERAFVDIRPATLSTTLTRAPVAIDKGLLRRVRVGQNDPETVRVAIELAGPVVVEIRGEKSPPRIVVDLRANREGEGAVAPPPPVAPVAPPSVVAPGGTLGPGARSAPVPPRASVLPPVATPMPTPTPAPEPSPSPTAWVATPTPWWPTPTPTAWMPTPTPTLPPWALATPTPTAWLPPAPASWPTPTAASWATATPAPAASRDWRDMYGGAATATPLPSAVAFATPPPVEAERLLPPTLPDETPPRAGRGHRVVVLDPGHGGKDPGAQGPSGVEEKRITLSIARLAAARLRKLDPSVKVLLTRGGDSYVALKDRTAFANAKGADLFVSIHVNAAENADSAGIETYTLNNSNDRATKRLAALENGLSEAGIERGDKDLAWIVSDLLQTGKEGESIVLAESLQRETLRSVRRRWSDAESLGVKKGPFFVLVGAYMPCALVETGFLSNARESSRIATQPYQEALADGIARGVLAFLASGEANSNL